MSIEETLKAILDNVRTINDRMDRIEDVVGKEPERMNVEQICEALHVGKTTVSLMFRDGILTNVGMGKRLFAMREEVMNARRIGGSTAARKRHRILREIDEYKKKRQGQASAPSIN